MSHTSFCLHAEGLYPYRCHVEMHTVVGCMLELSHPWKITDNIKMHESCSSGSTCCTQNISSANRILPQHPEYPHSVQDTVSVPNIPHSENYKSLTALLTLLFIKP